jgi:WD40 repeat protein
LAPAVFLTLLLIVPAIAQPVAAQGGLTLLWSVPYEVLDVAVSADGSHIAAINDTCLSYYSSDSPVPIWTFPMPAPSIHLWDVAISADGMYIALEVYFDNGGGQIGYFNSTSNQPQWASVQFTLVSWNYYDYPVVVQRSTLSISDDGDIVAAGGLYDSQVAYWDGCTQRNTYTEAPTWWSEWYEEGLITCIDMTPDGSYVVTGGVESYDSEVLPTVLDFNATGYELWWTSLYYYPGVIWDVAVSDDGYGVAAGVLYYYGIFSQVNYIADATEPLGYISAPNWSGGEIGYSYVPVDISGNGDRVTCGTLTLADTLFYWSNARTLQGESQEDWNHSYQVGDVAISSDGRIVAATTFDRGVPNSDYLRLFDEAGGELASFQLDNPGSVVSMSRDASLIAVATQVLGTQYVLAYREAPPVGGEILPLDKIALIGPYLVIALLLSITAASTLVLIKRRP